MKRLLAYPVAFLSFAWTVGDSALAETLLFRGQVVRMTHPAIDGDNSAVESATLCVGKKRAQCFTPFENKVPFGLRPQARIVQLSPQRDALLFTVTAAAGGSGSSTLLALLEPGTGSRLRNLLPGNLTISDQSEYEFVNEPSISALPLLVIADYVWSQGEAHFSDHRFRISTYALDIQLNTYRLRDEFMTHKKYPSLDKSDKVSVIAHERGEVLSRLRQQH